MYEYMWRKTLTCYSMLIYRDACSNHGYIFSREVVMLTENHKDYKYILTPKQNAFNQYTFISLMRIDNYKLF